MKIKLKMKYKNSRSARFGSIVLLRKNKNLPCLLLVSEIQTAEKKFNLHCVLWYIFSYNLTSEHVCTKLFDPVKILPAPDLNREISWYSFQLNTTLFL